MKKINENIKLIIVLIMAIVISSMISIKAATTLSSTSVYYDTSKSGGSSSNVNGAIDELYSLTTDRDKLKQEILDLTWPVGSVYISTTDSSVESVQERFGGTWVKYAEDMTLVGASSTKAVNTTGGSSSVTLSTSNLPSHSHSFTPLGKVSSTFNGTKTYTDGGGSHSHTIYGVLAGAVIANSKLVLQTDGNLSVYGSDNKLQWIAMSNGTSSSTIYRPVDIGADGTSSIVPDHSHTVTASGSVSSSFSGTAGTTGSTGSGSSFSVQDPYTAVYMYKRTA